MPGFPLTHFLEAFGGALVLEPQVVVLELLLADDVLPFGKGVPQLLAQVLEVFVLVETLYAFDEGAEFCGVFFENLLGGFFECGNLFLELVAQRVVALEQRVVAFECGELLPFAHKGMQVLRGRFGNLGIGEGLEHLEELWTSLGLFVRDFFGRDFLFGLFHFLGADQREVESLYAVGVHDGLLLVPFGSDFAYAVCLGCNLDRKSVV